jgi:hypothetical protein
VRYVIYIYIYDISRLRVKIYKLFKIIAHYNSNIVIFYAIFINLVKIVR